MDRQPALPTLTERIRTVPREVIEPWAIWDMKRLGALEPGFSEEVEGQDSAGRTFCKIEALTDALVVTIGGQVQRLGVTHTACGRLGRRAWWVCPVCSTRRGVIFLRSRNWGCRACMKLPYRSQRMSRLDRAIAKAKRLHILLGARVLQLPLVADATTTRTSTSDSSMTGRTDFAGRMRCAGVSIDSTYASKYSPHTARSIASAPRQR